MTTFVGDIKEENGKTIKENNMEREHKIPINTLVEVKYNEWFGEGACKKVQARLFVYSHDRDCDGTPLYTLAERPNRFRKNEDEIIPGITYGNMNPLLFDALEGIEVGGISEECLQYVQLTEEMKKGKDSLNWRNDE